jgi:hypothetical protein
MASDRDPVSRRMRPGAWDANGFLGPDEVLDDRIDGDAAICAELATTPDALGARLLDLLAEAGPGVMIMARDEPPISCPWALEQEEVCLRGPGGAPSSDWFTITLGDRTLEGYTLSAHLIAVHGFFGGLGSRFRIDPVRAEAVLAEIEPEVSP